jgi:hypothetical protein
LPDIGWLHFVGKKDLWIGVRLRSGRTLFLRYDGARFTVVPGSDLNFTATAIHGDDPSDLWFGSDEGEYMHWDGKEFRRDEPPARRAAVGGIVRAEGGTLFSVTGPTLDGSFPGAVLERQGNAWVDTSPTGRGDFHGVWGSAWNDVWAVGAGGVRLHFDGEGWKPAEPGRDEITGIWGSHRSDVWTVSVNGDIDHYDGRKWSTLYESGLALMEVWGLGNGELWMTVASPDAQDATGVAHYVRGNLETFDRVGGLSLAIWASSPTDVWLATLLVTKEGPISHYDGKTWESVPDVPLALVGGLWGRGPNDVYAVGIGRDATAPGDTLAHFDGTAWTVVGTNVAGGLSGCGDSDVFVGTRQFDGVQWTGPQMDVDAVWAASPNFVFGVGHRGRILRRSQ